MEPKLKEPKPPPKISRRNGVLSEVILGGIALIGFSVAVIGIYRIATGQLAEGTIVMIPVGCGIMLFSWMLNED